MACQKQRVSFKSLALGILVYAAARVGIESDAQFAALGWLVKRQFKPGAGDCCCSKEQREQTVIIERMRENGEGNVELSMRIGEENE